MNSRTFFTSSKIYVLYIFSSFSCLILKTFKTFDNKGTMIFFEMSLLNFLSAFSNYSPCTYFLITLYIYARELGTSTRRHCSLLVELRASQRSFALFLEYTRYEVPCTEACRADTRSRVLLESTCTHESRDTPCSRLAYVESRLSCVMKLGRGVVRTVNCVIVKFREISVAGINKRLILSFRRFSHDKTEKIFCTSCLKSD